MIAPTKQEGIIGEVKVPDMGNHLILDFVGTEVDLNDATLLDNSIRDILSHTSVTIEGFQMKQFDPQGVTLLYLLSESHVSIHTWPESKCCALDFFHCGPRSLTNLRIAEEKFCDLFGWDKCTSTMTTRRGKTTSLLTNDFVDKTDILRNVKMLHREKSPY